MRQSINVLVMHVQLPQADNVSKVLNFVNHVHFSQVRVTPGSRKRCTTV